jgi:acid phosphatase family membrane protein YuiD
MMILELRVLWDAFGLINTTLKLSPCSSIAQCTTLKSDLAMCCSILLGGGIPSKTHHPTLLASLAAGIPTVSWDTKEVSITTLESVVVIADNVSGAYF